MAPLPSHLMVEKKSLGSENCREKNSSLLEIIPSNSHLHLIYHNIMFLFSGSNYQDNMSLDYFLFFCPTFRMFLPFSFLSSW